MTCVYLFNILFKSISGNKILWNGAPVSFEASKDGQSFTQGNGQLWNGRSVYYNSLPLPAMRGTSDISSSKSNTLYLPSETTVWRITFDESLSNFSWTFVNEGSFLNGYSSVSIYKRTLPAGAHIINNTNTLFLFNATEDDLTMESSEKSTYSNV